MRKTAARIVAAALTLTLFLPSLYADVIPTKSPKDCRDEKVKVAAELVQRGVSPTESVAQVNEMSARDLEYFSEDGRRVQLAGGILLEEAIFGGIVLGAVAFGIFVIVDRAEGNTKAALFH